MLGRLYQKNSEENRGRKGGGESTVEFTYREIARLNRMIGIALMSGKIEFDEVSESVFNKVAGEIHRRALEDEPAKEV